MHVTRRKSGTTARTTSPGSGWMRPHVHNAAQNSAIPSVHPQGRFRLLLLLGQEQQFTAPSPTRSGSPPSPPKTSATPWGRRERDTSPVPEEVEAEDERASVRDYRTARMLEILRAASRAGRMSRGATYTTPEAPPVGAALGGCLMRFVILAIFLFIMLSLMLSLIGGSLFGPYYF